jgi:hypothetical protein
MVQDHLELKMRAGTLIEGENRDSGAKADNNEVKMVNAPDGFR